MLINGMCRITFVLKKSTNYLILVCFNEPMPTSCIQFYFTDVCSNFVKMSRAHMNKVLFLLSSNLRKNYFIAMSLLSPHKNKFFCKTLLYFYLLKYLYMELLYQLKIIKNLYLLDASSILVFLKYNLSCH